MSQRVFIETDGIKKSAKVYLWPDELPHVLQAQLDSEHVQCLGHTNTGRRCKNSGFVSYEGSFYCSLHEPPEVPRYRRLTGFITIPCPCGCGFDVLAELQGLERKWT